MLSELHAVAPITWRVAFLEISLDGAERELTNWRRQLGWRSKVKGLREPLPASLARLNPLDGKRDLLVETRGGRWTAWFTDDPFGGTDISPPSALANRLAVRMVHLVDTPQTISPDRRSGAWGAVQFQVLGPDGEPPLNYRRVVSAVNDAGRWAWHTSGTPFDFEDLERYDAKRVRDRLTTEVLESYAAALGIDVSNPAWYGPAASLVEAAGMKPHPAARTLEAARRSLRISAPVDSGGKRTEGRQLAPKSTHRRFSEEWNGAGDRFEELVAAFNDRFELVRKAGVVPDSAVLSYEDGSGTWSIVATITLEQARAMGYGAAELEALEQQEVFD